MSDAESHCLEAADNSSYVEYLKTIEDRWPEYKAFRKYLERNSKGLNELQGAGLTGHIHVHDILSDNSLCSPLTLKASENSNLRYLKNAFSNCPTGLRSRVILVDLNQEKVIDQRVLNLLRLSFNIEPLFFWSSLRPSFPPPRYQESLRMNYMVLKVLRNFPTASGNASVAIITLDKGKLVWASPASIDDFLFTLNEQASVSDNESPWNTPKKKLKYNGRIDLLQTFSSLLCAQQNTSPEEDMFRCLSLMARIHLAMFCRIVYDCKNYGTGQVAWTDRGVWHSFRHDLDCFQDDLRAFARYAKREFNKSIFRERLEKTRELQEDLCAEAQALEAHLRDRLQADVGLISLEESRKSIEEGRSVKLITILAFIFLPTSLASSIFGMNVQQINNTGKSIWVFTVTAILMTGAIVTAWALSFLVRAEWQRRPKWEGFSGKQRLSYVKWLVSHPKDWRKMPWGILLGLVTDGRYGYRRASSEVQARIYNRR